MEDFPVIYPAIPPTLSSQSTYALTLQLSTADPLRYPAIPPKFDDCHSNESTVVELYTDTSDIQLTIRVLSVYPATAPAYFLFCPVGYMIPLSNVIFLITAFSV